MSDCVQILTDSFASLGAEMHGVYKVEDIGRTKSTKVFPDGCRVQTWRRFKDREEQEFDSTIHIIRIPSNIKNFTFDQALALCFWLDPTVCRYRFMVCDQMSSDIFVPSRRTYTYADSAKKWWQDVLSPVLGSQVDSLLTSQNS